MDKTLRRTPSGRELSAPTPDQAPPGQTPPAKVNDAGSSTPTVPRQRAGTWSAAMPAPVMGNKPPALLPPDRTENLPPSGNASAHTPPLVSPRSVIAGRQKTAATATPVKASAAPAITTTTSVTTTTTTTSVATTKPTATSVSPGTPKKSVVGTPSAKLSDRARSVLNAALQGDGNIAPEQLGYLLVQVQTAGFSEPPEAFEEGRPFLRGPLVVTDFTSTSGASYPSINLVETLIEPRIQSLFDNQLTDAIARRMVALYRKQASQVEEKAKGLRPAELVASLEIQALMDDVVRPLGDYLCGLGQSLASSSLPEAWKKMLKGLDQAIVQWLKQHGCPNRTIVERRKEALVAFLSTRGIMVALKPMITEAAAGKMDTTKLLTYANAYITHRVDAFLYDIMLAHPPKQPDKTDTALARYVEVLAQRRTLQTKPGDDVGRASLSGSRQLTKAKTLRLPALASGDDDGGRKLPMSPREQQARLAQEKQEQVLLARKSFIRHFAKATKLANTDPAFYRFVQDKVEAMSIKGFERFAHSPVTYTLRYAGEYYADARRHQERKAGKDRLLAQQLEAARAEFEAKPPLVSTPASSSVSAAASTPSTVATSFNFPAFPTGDDEESELVSTVSSSTSFPARSEPDEDKADEDKADGDRRDDADHPGTSSRG